MNKILTTTDLNQPILADIIENGSLKKASLENISIVNETNEDTENYNVILPSGFYSFFSISTLLRGMFGSGNIRYLSKPLSVELFIIDRLLNEFDFDSHQEFLFYKTIAQNSPLEGIYWKSYNGKTYLESVRSLNIIKKYSKNYPITSSNTSSGLNTNFFNDLIIFDDFNKTLIYKISDLCVY